ncbi:MAG TPA: M20/M25/M40 family metallo-hydrolase [Rhizomicrobium sp.]|jgi:hypothetical protein
MRIVRFVVVALVAVAIWWVSKYDQSMPTPGGRDAPATEFSAGRAEDILARVLGPEKPHPAYSAENAAVRGRILTELARLGVPATTYKGTGCNAAARYGVIECGTVTDIIAEVRPGTGKAIVLLAHYDSVPAGPGAADDESGVATILESIRALKARGGDGLHPIIALFTDGEEYGLLGAASALDNPAFRARVGAVVNVEARGNQGPSLLFQTSPGDGPLVDLYAKSVTHYATSSLFATIYKYLPNDTDLTLFIRGGFVSYNFAFSDNVAHYHTPRDTRANLSPVTLQHHGENLLGMASSLEHVDFASLKGGKDDIYLTVMGKWLPRMSASWALPLSVLALVLIALAGWIGGAPPRWQGVAAGAGAPLALLVGSAIIGWVLHEIAALVSGQPDPSFAYPLALRISLALGVMGVTLLCARMLSSRGAALAGWLWYAVLAIVSAIFATGLSPYFLFPALIAIPLLFVAARFGWASWIGQGALALAAIPALFVWLGLVATGETLMGLALHPLFTVPAAFAAMAVLPLIGARAMPRQVWLGVSGVLFVFAIGAAVTAGLQPAYSAMEPQRLNVAYVEDHTTGKAVFAADAGAPLPAAMRATAPFAQTPESPYAFARIPAYIAPAGALRFPAPTASVSQSTLPNGRRVTLALHGSAEAGQMVLVVPDSAHVTAITINGKRIIIGAEWKNGVIVLCTTGDCAHANITLDTAGAAGFDLILGERRFGVPDSGAKIVAARPASAVQSQLGDSTVILAKVTVPKG